MSLGAALSEGTGGARSLGPPVFQFLEHNLESLRLSAETRQALLGAEPRGEIELLADGSPFVRLGAAPLGLPIPASDLFSQLSTVGEHQVVIVFGLGAGQVPRLARALCKAPIVVYEPDLGVLRRVLEYGPLDLGGIPIACGTDDLSRVWRDFGSRLLNVHVVTTPGYYTTYTEEVRAFVDVIPTLLQRAAISKATYQNRAQTWIKDIIENVELLVEAPPFLTLKGHYQNVPAFIIGAGPSLDQNVHLLAEAAEKGIVFATNSGAVSLAKHGIEPQVVVCIESIDASSKLAPLPFISRAVRAFSLSAAPETLRTGGGPLLLLHEAVPEYNGPLTTLTGAGGLPMSGSVSTIAFSLARLLGCSPVVLVGQDLAYSDGRTYASGTGYESSSARVDADTGVIHLAWNEEALRVHGETQGPQRTEEPLRRVQAWGGRGEVDSGAGFAGVQAWFESMAELIVKADEQARLINATEGGVSIAGFEELRLSEVLATLPRVDFSAASIAAAAHAAKKPIDAQRVCAWLAHHAESARSVRRAAHRLQRYTRLAARVTESSRPAQVTRAYERLGAAEAALRDAALRCPLVDAWSHRAIDEALQRGHATAPAGPHDQAREALQKSARVASVVAEAARELEAALGSARDRLQERERMREAK